MAGEVSYTFNTAFLKSLHEEIAIVEKEIAYLVSSSGECEQEENKIHEHIGELSRNITYLNAEAASSLYRLQHLSDQVTQIDHDYYCYHHCSSDLSVQVAVFKQSLQLEVENYNRIGLQLGQKERASRELNIELKRVSRIRKAFLDEMQILELQRIEKLKLIKECESYLHQLNTNPGFLYQNLSEYLRKNLGEYSYHHPELIASIEESILIEMCHKLNFFDSLPAHSHDEIRYRLAGLMGVCFAWRQRSTEGVSSKEFREILEDAIAMFHLKADDDLPDHVALGQSVFATYSLFKEKNPEALKDYWFFETEADKQKKYNNAVDSLQQTLNLYKNKVEYKDLIKCATAILNGVENAKSGKEFFDIRLHTNILKETQNLVNNPGHPAVNQRFLKVCGHYQVGKENKAGLIVGAALICLAVVAIATAAVFTCGAFGVITAAIFSTCLLAKIANIASFAGAGYCLYVGSKTIHNSRAKGLHAEFNQAVKAGNKIPPNIRLNLLAPPAQSNVDKENDKITLRRPSLISSMAVD